MKNTKVNLETIAREGTSFLMNKQADEEPDITKKIPYWMNYSVQEIGEEATQSMYELMENDPLKIGKVIDFAKYKHQKQLVDEVKRDPQSVIKNLDENYAIGIAIPYLGSNEDKALSDAVSNNGDVKGLFANLYDNDLWRFVVAIASPEAVKNAASSHMNRATQKSIIENLCDEKGYNASKTAGFLYEQVNKMEEKEQNSFYVNLGMAYTQMQMQSQAEAQKEAQTQELAQAA